MICAQAQLVLTPNSMPPGDHLASRDASRLPRRRWHPIGFPRPTSNCNCVPMHGGGLRPQGKQIMSGTPLHS